MLPQFLWENFPIAYTSSRLEREPLPFPLMDALRPVHTGDYSRRFRRQFVAKTGDCRGIRRQSPVLATVAKSATCQCGQAIRCFNFQLLCSSGSRCVDTLPRHSLLFVRYISWLHLISSLPMTIISHATQMTATLNNIHYH